MAHDSATHKWSTFREASVNDVRADMQEEYEHAKAAGIDPMSLYRGHFIRARELRAIIDNEETDR